MGLEATSWNWLRDGIKKTLPHFSLLERVENGVHTGTADVNYVLRGHEGWIELKAVDLPAREGTRVLGDKGLRDPDQINWHLARHQVLGKTWVFITAAPYRWLVSGVYAREINEWDVDMLCIKSRFWYDEKWGAAQWATFVRALTS
jgi:hypothetical protein